MLAQNIRRVTSVLPKRFQPEQNPNPINQPLFGSSVFRFGPLDGSTINPPSPSFFLEPWQHSRRLLRLRKIACLCLVFSPPPPSPPAFTHRIPAWNLIHPLPSCPFLVSETEPSPLTLILTRILILTRTRTLILDTTLRDGEQSPGATLQIHEKLKIARQLR
jgi:hypothetical protein